MMGNMPFGFSQGTWYESSLSEVEECDECLKKYTRTAGIARKKQKKPFPGEEAFR